MIAKKLPLFLLLAAPLVIGACSGKPQEGAPQASSPTPAHSAPAVAQQAGPAPAASAGTRKPDFAVPDPPEVLRTIYLQDSHGKSAMDIANGSRATYWYGQKFELKGRGYFSGFAFDTPEKYGNAADGDPDDPSAKVTLTASTFEAKAERGGDWSFIGSERDIGEFGGREQPDAIDEKRHSVSYETTNGQFILAIPTWFLEQGTEAKLWDVFVFNPDELKDVKDTHWTHVGTLQAGEDNSAACDDQNGPVPCVDSIGALSFAPQQGGSMPLIRIQFSGTTVEGPGKKRTLEASDVKTYRYDATKKQYEASP